MKIFKRFLLAEFFLHNEPRDVKKFKTISKSKHIIISKFILHGNTNIHKKYPKLLQYLQKYQLTYNKKYHTIAFLSPDNLEYDYLLQSNNISGNFNWPQGAKEICHWHQTRIPAEQICPHPYS